jgi:predicted transcriptional regulator
MNCYGEDTMCGQGESGCSEIDKIVKQVVDVAATLHFLISDEALPPERKVAYTIALQLVENIIVPTSDGELVTAMSVN